MLTEANGVRRFLPPAAALAIGVACALFCGTAWRDPLGVAFAAVVGCLLLVPLLAEDLEEPPTALRPRWLEYALSVLPLVGVVWLTSNASAAIVVASCACSAAGCVQLFRAVGLATRWACGLVLLQTAILLTWPVWSADLLLRYDPGVWLQRLIDCSPQFALNAAIAPAAPFTHRAWMYEWTNLGQDVPYAMPAGVWTCVLAHGTVAAIGFGAGWIRGRGMRRKAGPGMTKSE